MAIGLQVEERLRSLGIGKAEREKRALEYLGRVGLDTPGRALEAA